MTLRSSTQEERKNIYGPEKEDSHFTFMPCFADFYFDTAAVSHAAAWRKRRDRKK
jgi:hypothetical protein